MKKIVCPNCSFFISPKTNIVGYVQCGNCGYIFPEPPEPIEIPSTVIATGWSEDICPVATAIGRHSMEPDTLIIERCSKLKVEHNGIEIEFPLDSNILKSINTIEINGFKYVKEN